MRSGRHRTAPSPRRSFPRANDETIQPAPAGAGGLGEAACRPRQSRASRAVRASAILMSPPVARVEIHARDPRDYAVREPGPARVEGNVPPVGRKVRGPCLSIRETASAARRPRRRLPCALSGLSRQACGLLRLQARAPRHRSPVERDGDRRLSPGNVWDQATLDEAMAVVEPNRPVDTPNHRDRPAAQLLAADGHPKAIKEPS